jgi:hypothetical protein
MLGISGREVDAISRAIVDAQFLHVFADSAVISKIP